MPTSESTKGCLTIGLIALATLAYVDPHGALPLVAAAAAISVIALLQRLWRS